MNADRVNPAPTRVLLALIRVYERDGRATVRSVAAEANYRSSGDVHDHLSDLRQLGLVAFEPHRAGTLRPLVKPVPFKAAA